MKCMHFVNISLVMQNPNKGLPSFFFKQTHQATFCRVYLFHIVTIDEIKIC